MSSAIWIFFCATIFWVGDAQFDPSECVFEKTCVYVPENCQKNNICRQIFSYSLDSDGWATVEVMDHPTTENANFVAVGFSKDNFMGEDAVTHCGFGETGNAEVHLSYNNGKSNTPLLENAQEQKARPPPQLLQASKENGLLYCKFRQSRGSTEHDDPSNLHDNFTLFIVHGVTDDITRVSVHSLDHDSEDFPTVVEGGANFAVEHKEESERPKKSSIPTSLRKLLVRTHGVIMVIAWFVLIASAVTAARYLRNVLPNKPVLGVHLWFLVHRTLNILAVTLIILSTVVVFFAKGWRWTGAAVGRTEHENLSPGAIHSTIGATAVGLAILQPFIAIFRCAPESPSRPIFRIIHRIVGLSACILAVLAVLLAAIFFHLWLDSTWAVALVTAYVVLVITFAVGAEVTETISARRSPTISFEMNGDGGRHRAEQINGHSLHTTKRNPPAIRLLLTLFALFVLFAVAIVIALIFLIVSS